MTMYAIDYTVTTREGMSTDADDVAQAEQFTKEFIEEAYGPDVVSYEITEIKEID